MRDTAFADKSGADIRPGQTQAQSFAKSYKVGRLQPAQRGITRDNAETHIAILRVDRLVERMEQAFALMQSELDQLPRATNFISGPSRTADIEQTIVIGAHGPRRVHIILVG